MICFSTQDREVKIEFTSKRKHCRKQQSTVREKGLGQLRILNNIFTAKNYHLKSVKFEKT